VIRQRWPIAAQRGRPGDIWQSHFSVAGGQATSPPEDFIGQSRSELPWKIDQALGIA